MHKSGALLQEALQERFGNLWINSEIVRMYFMIIGLLCGVRGSVFGLPQPPPRLTVCQ